MELPTDARDERELWLHVKMEVACGRDDGHGIGPNHGLALRCGSGLRGIKIGSVIR